MVKHIIHVVHTTKCRYSVKCNWQNFLIYSLICVNMNLLCLTECKVRCYLFSYTRYLDADVCVCMWL